MTIPNEMILASAGSGKTWQLTNRFIAIMGRQLLTGKEVTPERIVALTFTRKAAGEFFDSILEKLAKAASDEKFAAGLAGDEALDPEAKDDPLRPILRALQPADYQTLLRVFITRMPRLFLGTLDSFFAAILRSFPAEFGLAGGFEILSGHPAEEQRERVCRVVFQRALPSLQRQSESLAAQQEFLEAFRRATFGREESRIREVFDEFVEYQHEILLHAPERRLWGEAGTIWPKGCHWLDAQVDLQKARQQLRERLEAADTHEKSWEFWNEFLEELADYLPGGKLTSRVDFFVKKALEQWSAIEAKNCELTVNRQKQKLEGHLCDAFAAVIRHIVGGELRARLERTRGVWAVLTRYEQAWAREVRRRGRLTFKDMALILGGHEFTPGLRRPHLTQALSTDERLRIDYRLDARYDHWLLDEFQDTNSIQWSVIENLIDEVVQDTEDARTLFQVGDVKQAIYAWRGGDTRLFDDIFARYSAGSNQRVRKRPLNVSWRSGHDVIDMVNRVFGDTAALNELKLPAETIQRWPWQPHQVAAVHDAMPGHAMLLHPVPADGEKVTQEDLFEVALALLEEIQPVQRGWSCAILVQSNKDGREIVDFIRSRTEGRIPVMCESEIAIATDNALTLALLSILKVAAHPGDTFAWQHLLMTPFRHLLEGKTPGHLAREVMRMVFDEGFEATLRHWTRALEEGGTPLDVFSRHRVEDFALAARLFDEGGTRDVDEFITYAEAYTVGEPDTRQAVQVMTIHKSKGLTFDCVILPDVEGKKLTEVRRGIGVKRARDRQVEWVYDLPPSDLVRADAQLAAFRAGQEADAAYEELCKFYVALTRAKHANYIIAKPPGKNSKSENFIKLLHQTLVGDRKPTEREFGGARVMVAFESDTKSTQPHWYEKASSKAPAPPPSPAPPVPVTGGGRRRPTRRTPSGSETSVVTARQLFSRGGRFARAYGTLVHALFEQIEWLDEMNTEQINTAWASVPCVDEGVRARAEEEARRCLATAEVRKLLSRPSRDAVCWREKRFEILLEGEWLSGTFDRVVLEADRATILDFKTDKTETDEALAARMESYRPQLDTYRKVLARMTGLSAEKIGCQLLFTHRGQVVTL